VELHVPIVVSRIAEPEHEGLHGALELPERLGVADADDSLSVDRNEDLPYAEPFLSSLPLL
jgi:hypothetical protein